MVPKPEGISVLKAGDVVAERYEIVRFLGQGGVGVVYEAKHTTLGRSVALKTLLPHSAERESTVSRFLQEAKAAASIGHPGIVEVFDLGQDEGLVFVAMELLEGEELTERINSGTPLSEGLVARIGADMADAVAAAHEQGIVHRDLKPSNVFLARKGRKRDIVKVLDFGLAKLTANDGISDSITRTGEVFGTPLYMSPEQLRNAKDVDGRVDIYAMGVILYESLCGTPPYMAETFSELVLKIATEDPTPLAELRPDLSPGLVEVVEKAMATDLEDRYQSSREICDALEVFLESIGEGARNSSGSYQRSPSKPTTSSSRIGSPPSTPLLLSDLGEKPDGAEEKTPRAVESASRPPARPDSISAAPISQDLTPEVEKRSGSKWMLLMAMALVITIGAGLAFYLGQGSSDSAARAPASAAHPEVGASEVESSESSKATPAPNRNTIELAVRATPEKAKVFVDEAELPSNPFVGRFPRDGVSHRLRIEAAGFQPHRRIVVFDRDHSIEHELVPDEASSAPQDGDAGVAADSSEASTAPVKQERERARERDRDRRRKPPPTKGQEVFPENEDPWSG